MKNITKPVLSLSLLIITIITYMFTGVAYSAENNVSESQDTVKHVTIIKNDASTDQRYLIIPGDVLSLSVYDEPDLAQPEVVVRTDGYVTIPPVGEIYAEGSTIQDLTKVLQEKFKDFINDPVISVGIAESSPPSVYIFGAVMKPGTYQQMTQVSKYYADSKNPIVRTDLTLTNVIANAGGVADYADLSNITVTSSDKKVTRVDLWKFIKDGDISQNIKLKMDDTIYVPKLTSSIISDEEFKTLVKMSLSPQTYPVRVVGEVKQGNIVNLNGDSPYLDSAIAGAGGFTLQDAKKSVVVVYRKDANDKLSKIYVSPLQRDFVLRPNDLVEVKRKRYMDFAYAADAFSRVITPLMNIPYAANSWADLVNPRRRYYYY